MRAWVLVLFIPLASASGPDLGIDWTRIEATHGALDYLVEAADEQMLLEAAAAARMDIAVWPADGPLLGRVSIAAPDGAAGGPIRLVGAAAASGYNPRAFPTPEGPVDLLQMTRDNHEAVMASTSVAAISFHASALRSAGEPLDSPMMLEAGTRLRDSQNTDGGWPCAGEASNLDCTGFVVAALHGLGVVPLDAAAAIDYIQAHENDAGFLADASASGPNAQSTAWALTALQHLDVAPDGAHRNYLLGLQQDDGGFWLTHEAPGLVTWVTAEVLPALTNPHPLPRSVSIQIEGPRHAASGEIVDMVVVGAQNLTVQWKIPGDQGSIAFLPTWSGVLPDGRNDVRVFAQRDDDIGRAGLVVEVGHDEDASGLFSLAALLAALVVVRRMRA